MYSWFPQYFGRLCINGVMVDVVADKKMNSENYNYKKILWEGYSLNIEQLEKRYEIEKQRNRIERIKRIEEYMEK